MNIRYIVLLVIFGALLSGLGPVPFASQADRLPDKGQTRKPAPAGGTVGKTAEPRLSVPAQTQTIEQTKLSAEDRSKALQEGQRLDGISCNLYSQGKFQEAIEPLKQSTEIYRRVLGPNHYYVGDNYTHLGEMYLKLNRLNDAELCYKQALVVFEKCGGSCQTQAAVENYASLLRKSNRSAEAAALETKYAGKFHCPPK